MTQNQPYFVGSMTSGVDGASEGGRLSTIRLPTTLMLYSVPLLQELKRRGYAGTLTAEPGLLDGCWVIKLIYDGDPPGEVPGTWQGHRVVLEQAAPPAAEEGKQRG